MAIAVTIAYLIDEGIVFSQYRSALPETVIRIFLQKHRLQLKLLLLALIVHSQDLMACNIAALFKLSVYTCNRTFVIYSSGQKKFPFRLVQMRVKQNEREMPFKVQNVLIGTEVSI